MLISAVERGQQRHQQVCQLCLRARTCLHHFLVVDGLIEDAGSHVGDAGDAKYLDLHVPGNDDFVDCRHANQIGSQSAEGADFRRRFEAGPGDAQIDALRELSDGVGEQTQALRIGVGHVKEARPEAFVIRAGDRIAAGEIDVVGEQDQLALFRSSRMPPAAFVITRVVIPRRPRTRIGKVTSSGAISLIGVDAALHHRDGSIRNGAENQPAAMPFDARLRKMGNIAISNTSRLFNPRREGPQSGSKYDTHPRSNRRCPRG